MDFGEEKVRSLDAEHGPHMQSCPLRRLQAKASDTYLSSVSLGSFVCATKDTARNLTVKTQSNFDKLGKL